MLASTVRMLLWDTGNDHGSMIPREWTRLARSFYRDRAELSDMLPPTPIGAADVTSDVDITPAAQLHNGRWIEPRFTETDAPDPMAGCADCPQRTISEDACCGAWSFY